MRPWERDLIYRRSDEFETACGLPLDGTAFGVNDSGGRQQPVGADRIVHDPSRLRYRRWSAVGCRGRLQWGWRAGVDSSQQRWDFPGGTGYMFTAPEGR